MSNRSEYPVMAVAVASQRLAYIIVDENKLILDYAIWDFRFWDKRLLWSGLKHIAKRHKIGTVCLQDTNDPEYRLGEMSTSIIKHVHRNLHRNGVAIKPVSKAAVRQALGMEATATKEEITSLLVGQSNQVAHLAPHPREGWRNEHRNMCLFVALGLATVLTQNYNSN